MTDPVGEYDPSIVLEPLKFVLEHDLTDEYLKHFSLEVIRDHLLNHYRFRLRTDVWGQRLAPETHVHHAVWHDTRWATWWDHFKDTYQRRWWLRWLVRRQPVRYIEITYTREIVLTVETARTFPEVNFRVPDDFGPTVYHQHVYTKERWHPW